MYFLMCGTFLSRYLFPTTGNPVPLEPFKLNDGNDVLCLKMESNAICYALSRTMHLAGVFSMSRRVTPTVVR